MHTSAIKNAAKLWTNIINKSSHWLLWNCLRWWTKFKHKSKSLWYFPSSVINPQRTVGDVLFWLHSGKTFWGGFFLLFQDNWYINWYITDIWFVNTGTWLPVLVPPFLQILLIPNKTQVLSPLLHIVSCIYSALWLVLHLSGTETCKYFSKYGFLTLQ